MSNNNLSVLALNAKLLERPIAFQPVFVRLLRLGPAPRVCKKKGKNVKGRINAICGAIMLSQAMYWQQRALEPDGSWWKTQEQWQDETGLDRAEQESARRTLSVYPWWQENLRGVPAKMYYRVDYEELSAALSSLLLDGKLDCVKPTNKNVPKQRSGPQPSSKHIDTENTAKITAETTHTADVCVDDLKKILKGPFLVVDPAWICGRIAGCGRKGDDVVADLDRLVWQYTIGGDKIRKHPEGLIIAAIRTGWAAPEGYIPQDRREAEVAQKREAFEEKRRVQAAEDEALKEAESKLISLPNAEREQIFAKAKSNLQPFLRRSRMAVRSEAIRLMMLA